MHKSATKCNETVGKWCKNKHGASKIIDTFETYESTHILPLATSTTGTVLSIAGSLGMNKNVGLARPSELGAHFVHLTKCDLQIGKT
jgi:hypothetical protein